MTTIFFYVLLFQIKDWDKICEEEGKMTSPIICYILLGVILAEFNLQMQQNSD